VRVPTRAREEAGMGLVELLIAMTVMVIGISAIVAGLSSGIFALNRASRASTAATLADIQMEGYRKVRYSAIAMSCGSPTTTPAATDCPVSNTVLGPDGRSYRLDESVRWDCAVGALDGMVDSPICKPIPPATLVSRPAKLVTIAVYDLSTSPAKELFHESSTFDQATG
jgi:type II secretory pathway pseudopilin PulG